MAGLNIYEVIRIQFRADRVIKLDDGATQTPNLDALDGQFSMLGDLWRYTHTKDNTVYFARVVEVQDE